MWVQFDRDFHKKMSEFEKRLPWQDYGPGRFKPFFRLFSIGGLTYVSQVTSIKQRNKHLHSDLDITVVRDINTDKPLSMVNLNYMFPVFEKNIIDVSEEEIIEIISHGRNEDEINYYIKNLAMQKEAIKKSSVYEKAVSVYQNIDKKDYLKVKGRSFNFEELETEVIRIELERLSEDENEIDVAREGNFFILDIDETRFVLKYEDLENLENIHQNYLDSLEFDNSDFIIKKEDKQEYGR